MFLLQLEAHFFSKGYRYPKDEDIPNLLSAFKSLELMPQYFEEHNLQKNTRNKMLGFNNNIVNRGVFFRSDRVVFNAALNPLESERRSFLENCDEFLEFSNTVLKIFSDYHDESLESNRLSLVANLVKVSDVDAKSSCFAQQLASSFPWCAEGLNEMNLRTGVLKEIEGFNEQFNALININDGMMDTNANGFRETKPCFLINMDFNTLAEKSKFRFSVDEAKEIWHRLSVSMDEQSNEISSFFIG